MNNQPFYRKNLHFRVSPGSHKTYSSGFCFVSVPQSFGDAQRSFAVSLSKCWSLQLATFPGCQRC
jgi:hypothetical protein